MSKWRKEWIAVGVALAVAAVGFISVTVSQPAISIGAKSFTEQRILAEMVAQVAEANDIKVSRIVPYPEGGSPAQGLADGRVDLYVEYTGTGLLGLGLPPIVDSDLAFETVQEESEQLGAVWLPRLGFNNDFVIAVTPQLAAREGLETISDLRRLEGPFIMGTSTDFVRRPIDGLTGLVARYGLRVDPNVFSTNNKEELYGALRNGAVDVVQGFSTDPEIDVYDLVLLEDDLDFFPAYDAAPITRESVLAQFPELEPAMDQLAGRIDVETMRRLIGQVEFEDRDPAAVARQELIALGLVPGEPEPARADTVTVAVGLDEVLAGATGRALEAIRAAYLGRPVTVIQREDPADAVLRGDARIAITTAELLFEPEDRDQGRDRPVKALEAVAAVELRAVQVLVRPGAGTISTVAVGGPGSPSYEVTATLEEVGGIVPVTVNSEPGAGIAERVQAVLADEADATVVVAPLGSPDVQQALDEGLELRSIRGASDFELSLRAPFLRPGEIPAGTYTGQDGPIATVTEQTVVAAPATGRRDVPGVYGPNAFVGGASQPLSPAATRTIQTLLEAPAVDPTLPRTPPLLTDPEELPQATNPDPWGSALNIAVLVGVVAVMWLLFGRKEPEAGTGDETVDVEDGPDTDAALAAEPESVGSGAAER